MALRCEMPKSMPSTFDSNIHAFHIWFTYFHAQKKVYKKTKDAQLRRKLQQCITEVQWRS